MNDFEFVPCFAEDIGIEPQAFVSMVARSLGLNAEFKAAAIWLTPDFDPRCVRKLVHMLIEERAIFTELAPAHAEEFAALCAEAEESWQQARQLLQDPAWRDTIFERLQAKAIAQGMKPGDVEKYL